MSWFVAADHAHSRACIIYQPQPYKKKSVAPVAEGDNLFSCFPYCIPKRSEIGLSGDSNSYAWIH